MQSASDFDNAEGAAARKRYEQMQVAFSDLGTEARNSNAYTAQTDSRGRAVNSNPTQDAQLIAQHQQRQTQLQASADELTRTWNSKQQSSFLYQGHFTDL